VSDVTRDELVERLGEEGLVLIDVRSAGEFAGEAGYPCDSRRGHIPGARHVDVGELFSLDAAGVRARIGASVGSEVIAYCHSGGRSATAVQLLRAAGYEARNFVGSWHEWSADEELPIESP
jgi:thiosulfate/3-mercaptopyruvate sulfurtransferase